MKMLVAMDLTAGGARVSAFAKRLARSLQGEVWLLHVADPEPDFVGYDAGPQVERDLVAGELRQEHRDLQQLADQWRAEGIECTALLVQGPTSATILVEATRLGAELIVLGTHAKGAMRRLFGSSTSDGVVAQTKVPVVLVPSVAQ